MSDYERIACVIRYLNKNHADQPDLTKLAKNVGLCPYHFRLLFSAWAGITPKDFLQCLWIALVLRQPVPGSMADRLAGWVMLQQCRQRFARRLALPMKAQALQHPALNLARQQTQLCGAASAHCPNAKEPDRHTQATSRSKNKMSCPRDHCIPPCENADYTAQHLIFTEVLSKMCGVQGSISTT